jgi:hypothetical protein
LICIYHLLPFGFAGTFFAVLLFATVRFAVTRFTAVLFAVLFLEAVLDAAARFFAASLL